MGISHDIISEFVKITNDKKEKPKEETVYATIVQASDGKYVKIDGSDLITPTETTTDIEEGERVTVLIKDHSAIITGNITSPSASVNRVNGIADVVSEKLGVFEHIVADKIDVNELNAYKATVEYLIAGKAEIDDLKATRAEIGFLDADVAHIKTLVNGNLTSDNILSFNITADKVTMADAFIKDAMVATINAAKINAGRINTNNVVIGSDDGGMLISGATQQFTDKNGKVRIQIGRDSTGDFTFVLYGEDGTGQIINQNGITASAVSDGLIVNDMINNNAAISGGKLDISSVIFEINNENNTAIHSSKIYLDEQNQSLEAAFNSLKTQVDTIVDVSIDGDLKAFTDQIQSNTAKIEMNKSSINTLVSEDAIIRKEVSDLEGNLIETSNTLSSKYSSLEQNMDGFKLEVADVYAKKSTVKDLENDIATNYATTEVMNSAITQNATQIALAVTKEEIKNSNITGVNLFRGTQDYQPTEIWWYENVYITEELFKGSKVCRIEADWMGMEYNLKSLLNDKSLNVGETYTMSVWAKTNGENCHGGFYCHWGSKQGLLITSEWQRFEWTFIFTQEAYDGVTNTSTIRFEPYDINDTNINAFVACWKLEKGKIATDYQPSSRDYPTTTQMDSAIEQKAENIALSVSETKIKNLKLGGANLLLNSDTKKQLDAAEPGRYNEISYELINDYSNSTLENDTTFTLSFLVERTGNPGHECFASIVFDNGWNNRWYVHDIDKVINVKTSLHKIVMKPITLPRGTNISDKLTFIAEYEFGGALIYNVMLVEGDKALDWSLASQDIQNSIARIDIKADEISSTVNTTIQNLNDNYPTTTRMNSVIEQAKDSIKSEVFKIEKSMAIDNLLANGNFTNGLNNWTYNAHGYDIAYDLSSNTYYTMVGKTALLLLASNHPQGIDSGFNQTIDVKPNTNYTFTGYVASHRAEGLVIVKDEAENWLIFDKTVAYSDEYVGGDDITKWKRIRLVYNSGNRYKLQLHLALGTSNENGHVWFHDFMVTEGETDLCWKPSERETRTQINQLSDRITSTVSSVEMVNGKVNQANSDIGILSDRITSTVSSISKIEKSMAIDNLLANGNFTNGLNNWTYNAHGYDIAYDLSSNTYYTMVGKTALLLLASNHPQGIDSGFNQTIDVKPNTNYTFTGYVASHRAEGLVIVKDEAENWLIFDKTVAYSDEYVGGDDITKWKRIRLVYNSGNRYKLQLHLALGTSNENGHVWFHDFMVTEGETDLCWKPSERETRTQINQLSDRITSTVSSVEMVNGKVDQAQSQINQLSDRITSTVSSIQTVDGKVNQAQSQINQQASQIASKVNTGDFSSLVQQNSSSIYTAISNGRGVNGIGIDTSGLYLHNNDLVTARLTEGKFHAYNSWNGKHMGYFGTNGDDLRACLYDTNTFSVYSNDTALLFKARYERDASYGNATLDMCGGINFIHKPGQNVGINQIALGNDDRADIYGYHNLSIRAHNSLGFMDNNGLTNMYFATRTGSIVMKGTVYQNSQSGISTFSLLRSREVVNDYGYTTEDMVNSILTLETSVNVDENEDYSMRICSSENELVTKILGDSLHIDQSSVIAGLVETVKSLNNRILELESELKK